MDQALNSQKTPHTSPLRASYGMSFVSILMKNDRVIKGFYCTSIIKCQMYLLIHSKISMIEVWGWMSNVIPLWACDYLSMLGQLVSNKSVLAQGLVSRRRLQTNYELTNDGSDHWLICASPALTLQYYSVWELQWCHNGHNGVSNHQHHGCLLNRLFGCRSKKTSKLRVTGLCAGNSPVTGDRWNPVQMASNAENVSILWRHHGYVLFVNGGRAKWSIIYCSAQDHSWSHYRSIIFCAPPPLPPPQKKRCPLY